MCNMYVHIYMVDMVLYNCIGIILLYNFIKDKFEQFGNTPPCNQ